MSPSALLACLNESGFAVRADAGRLLVSPASQLTPELREEIAAAKADLLELLAVEAQTPLEQFLLAHSPLSPVEILIDRGGGRYAAVPLSDYQAAVEGLS